MVADEEALPFAPGSLDLVVSAMALQSVNDLPGVLAQVRRALKPDGLFMAALLGGSSLTELRQAFAIAESETTGGLSPRVAPFADVRDLGALLQRAGFTLPVTDVDRVVVRYSSPLHPVCGSEADGRGQCAQRTPPRAAAPGDAAARGGSLCRALRGPRRQGPRDVRDRVPLRPGRRTRGQQKPLRPGTARMRLADALKVPEQPLRPGDEPG